MLSVSRIVESNVKPALQKVRTAIIRAEKNPLDDQHVVRLPYKQSAQVWKARHIIRLIIMTGISSSREP